MKSNRSSLLQTVFGTWLATLLCLLIAHYVAPHDAWAAMFSRPVFLLIVPIVVGCIPILAAKSMPGKNGHYKEGDLDTEQRRRKIDGKTVWKMAVVWLVSLLVFAFPHYGTPMAALDFIWHNPLFLIIVPLLLACIPLPAVSSKLRRSGISYRQISDDSPYLFWKGIISSVILAVILVLCLIGVNSMKGAVGKLSVNIAILVLLVGDLAGMWSMVKRLRRRRDNSLGE
ncbi:MAG TPA: hypothetical protein VGU25_17980 [Acidobacteriaceae bacterium]|nr:hypothetical protein [Acidobacteriaceae bacterium]